MNCTFFDARAHGAENKTLEVYREAGGYEQIPTYLWPLDSP